MMTKKVCEQILDKQEKKCLLIGQYVGICDLLAQLRIEIAVKRLLAL